MKLYDLVLTNDQKTVKIIPYTPEGVGVSKAKGGECMQADREQVTRLIKTARGQLDGVLKMVEEDQYCMDIANQLMASSAVIKKALKEVLRAHMAGCVSQAFEEGSEKAKQEKIDELIQVIERMTR